MRYAKRRDGNHAEIVAALRQGGFQVFDYASAGYDIPDLLVTKRRPDGTMWVMWVEVKVKTGRLTDGQKRFQGVFQPRREWYEARDPATTVIDLQEMYLQALNKQFMVGDV